MLLVHANRVALMLLVHANRVAHGAIGGGRCVMGGVCFRSELLLMQQVMIPIILLPLGIHAEHRWRTKMIAGSSQFEQES